MKKLGKFLGASVLVALFVTDAMAQVNGTGLAGMIGQSQGQFRAIADFMGYISYIVGIACVFKAIMKLKEHNESKGQIPISNAIFLFAAGGLFLSLPYIYSVAAATTSGGGSGRTGLQSSTLETVN